MRDDEEENFFGVEGFDLADEVLVFAGDVVISAFGQDLAAFAQGSGDGH